MPDRDPKDLTTREDLVTTIINAILELIGEIPESTQKAVPDPSVRCRELITTAALKAAAISGALALPPGPLGLVTVLPDLFAIWRLQAHLVSDIAAAYGKTAYLTRETMLYCLFRHAAAQTLRDIVIRVGERVLVRRTSLRAMQKLLQNIGVKITQRLLGRGVSRFIPIVGAVGVAAYAFYDTRQVGKAAVYLFSQQIENE